MSGSRGVLVAAAGVVVMLLLCFFVLVRPRQARLGDAHAEIQQQEDRTQQLETELARLEALRDNAPQLRATLARIRQLVPETDRVADFIVQVQTAANAAGVGFVNITPTLPKPPPEGAELAEVRATIGAQGGYFAIQDFMRRLYDLERALRIDNVTMTGVEDDTAAIEEGRLDVQLSARVFFELPEGGAAAPATATPAPAPSP